MTREVRMPKAAFSPMTPVRRGAELLNAIGPQLAAVPSANPEPPMVAVQGQDAGSRSADERPSKPVPFVLRLSPDVFRQIDGQATEAGVTMTVIIARALQAAGFEVPEDDLKDRRKRRYRG